MPDDEHAHEDVYVAIRDAFDAARRQLQDQIRTSQGKVKVHEVPPHGCIIALVPDQDYGKIETPDGKHVYFHRNSVIDADFNHLNVGDAVHFSEEMGEHGLQASTVHVEGKHHVTG